MAARGAGHGRRRLGGPIKPYEPPALPDGKINTSDPDSRVMRTPGTPPIQGYNAQTTVDDKQIILAVEVTVDAPDFAHLQPLFDATLRELARHGIGELSEAVIADAGYWHTAQMQVISERGIEVLIPPDGTMRKGKRPGWENGLYALMRERLSTDEGRESTPSARKRSSGAQAMRVSERNVATGVAGMPNPRATKCDYPRYPDAVVARRLLTLLTSATRLALCARVPAVHEGEQHTFTTAAPPRDTGIDSSPDVEATGLGAVNGRRASSWSRSTPIRQPCSGNARRHERPAGRPRTRPPPAGAGALHTRVRRHRRGAPRASRCVRPPRWIRQSGWRVSFIWSDDSQYLEYEPS